MRMTKDGSNEVSWLRFGVCLIHAEKKINDSIRAVISGVEDELKLEDQVSYKRRYKERDNVASEIVEMMRKLDDDDLHCKAIIFLSSRLCEVMKNNKDISTAFQDLVLKDQVTPGNDRRLALLWDKDLTISDAIFQEAFTMAFVNHFKFNTCGVKCRADPNDMKLPSFVNAIVKQWKAPVDVQSEVSSSGVPMNEDTTLDIDSVHIVHGGDKAAKQAVREISRELEDGFQLMDPTKYKLYNRIQDHQIPEVVMSEVKSIIDNDGPNTLGVVTWCQRLLDILLPYKFRDKFEALIVATSQKRVVHMCLGVNRHVIGRHFPKLVNLAFISLERLDDGTIDTTDLINRVKLALDQCNGNLSREELAFSSTEANPPSAGQYSRASNQHAMDERKMSEPSYLSSQDGKAPTQMRTSPVHGLSSSMGLVGNPSNQNQQGGRVVPSACSSHSKDSAGYASGGNPNPGNGKPVHAQPSSGGSSGNQGSKYVGVNGGSWNCNALPAGSLDPSQSKMMMQMGVVNHQSRPPLTPSQIDINQEGQQASGQLPLSRDGSSGVYHQATPSESSSDTAKYLANGDSMPLTSIHSMPFGSKEPVLPQSDATVECPSGFKDMDPNSNNSQFPNNLCAPSRNGQYLAAEIAPNIRPAPHDDRIQRPTGNKIPRRDNTGDISMSSPEASASPHQEYPSGIPPSTGSVASYGGGFASLQMIPNQSIIRDGPASLPTTTSLNMPGPVSRQGNASCSSVEVPFVQVAEDNPHDCQSLNGLPYATNMNSKDAFEQEDYQEGSGQKLPNNVIGAEFRSLPPTSAGRRVRNEGAVNDDERVHTSPGRINHNQGFPMENSFPEEPTNPPDFPIKDMDYRCREMLKIMLDPETNTGSDWKVFAYFFKMKFEEVRYVDSLQKSSTLYLFNWLHEKRPEITCGDFKNCAQIHQRLDVVRRMNKFHY
ncbi:uncharacterized protein LOC129265360 isoform X1 [Lytechinus pictus]|uniref:uncharacterized protein LOC129265360 isoform X1 n=2 Tax=Lytechinus pictus TaxID=7653 RepID=UPI0030BA0A47